MFYGSLFTRLAQQLVLPRCTLTEKLEVGSAMMDVYRWLDQWLRRKLDCGHASALAAEDKLAYCTPEHFRNFKSKSLNSSSLGRDCSGASRIEPPRRALATCWVVLTEQRLLLPLVICVRSDFR